MHMHRRLPNKQGLAVWRELTALARFVVLNLMGSAASLVIGFGASVALARWLGPAGRGLFGVMISANSLALALTSVGLPLAVIYFASRRDASPAKILGNMLLCALVLTALFIPLGVFGYEQLAHALGHGAGGRAWILVAVLVPVVFLDWTTHGQIQGMMLFGRFNILLTFSRVAYALAIVVLLGVLNLGVSGAVIATALASGVMIAGSLGPILERGRPRIEMALLRRMMSYGSRVQIGAIFQITNARLDVIVMQLYRPLSQVGYYVIAENVAELVITLARAFQSSVMPLTSSYDGDQLQASTSIDSVRHYGILATVGVFCTAIFGPLIILFAFGSQYSAAIVPMLVLLPGVWFMGAGVVIQGDLGGRGYPGISSALAGLAAGATVLLDFMLIPPFGAIGAAVASVIAYTTFGVASLVALHRVSGIPLRELTIPTRADLARYGSLPRRLIVRLKAASSGNE